MADSPEQLHRAFQDAFNRHDLESIVALYETGAVLAGVDGPVEGTDAIRERYRYVLATRPTIEVQTLGVNRAGDLAMLHGKWILRETIPRCRSSEPDHHRAAVKRASRGPTRSQIAEITSRERKISSVDVGVGV